MKRIAFVLLLCTLFVGSVAGYTITLNSYERIQVGQLLVVTGQTNIPIGTYVDIVLSYNPSFSEEIARKRVYILGDRTFQVIFDTTGMKTGQYKIEVRTRTEFPFSSDSTTAKTIQLVDRLNEVELSSPLKQAYNGTLDVTGRMPALKNRSVQITITNKDGTIVFGPEYIPTNSEGRFSRTIPINSSGGYDVSFTDTNGFIGTIAFMVSEPEETPVATETTPPDITIISAHALAKKDKSAYFEVTKKSGDTRIFTSDGTDWVIEYIDENGVIHIINNRGRQAPEEVTLSGRRRVVFVKVTPFSYSDSGTVNLSAENAESVRVLPSTPPPFAAAMETPSPTQSSVPLFLAGIAMVLAFFVRRR
jgi:hypothetical protein